MFIIGITGGTGAGKTSALRALEALDALVMDCDAIYHELLRKNEKLKTELDARFSGVLVDGQINRKALGQIVFNDKKALSDLNEITHKYVGWEIERELSEWEKNKSAHNERFETSVAAIDAIALIESGRAKTCDVTVGIYAPKEIRISRIMARDAITREQAEIRIAAQKPDGFYERNCDYMLEGKYDTSEEFEAVCRKFFSDLLARRIGKQAGK